MYVFVSYKEFTYRMFLVYDMEWYVASHKHNRSIQVVLLPLHDQVLCQFFVFYQDSIWMDPLLEPVRCMHWVQYIDNSFFHVEWEQDVPSTCLKWHDNLHRKVCLFSVWTISRTIIFIMWCNLTIWQADNGIPISGHSSNNFANSWISIFTRYLWYHPKLQTDCNEVEVTQSCL